MKIRVGDLVKIITGDNKKKHKIGKIVQISSDKSRVKIENISPIKKHIKPKKHPKHPEGGIIKDLATIHISNVMIMAKIQSRPVRIGTSFTEDGKKIRIAKGKNIKAEIL
jgi:large subunit ribosomal protein L24